MKCKQAYNDVSMTVCGVRVDWLQMNAHMQLHIERTREIGCLGAKHAHAHTHTHTHTHTHSGWGLLNAFISKAHSSHTSKRSRDLRHTTQLRTHYFSLHTHTHTLTHTHMSKDSLKWFTYYPKLDPHHTYQTHATWSKKHVQSKLYWLILFEKGCILWGNYSRTCSGKKHTHIHPFNNVP